MGWGGGMGVNGVRGCCLLIIMSAALFMSSMLHVTYNSTHNMSAGYSEYKYLLITNTQSGIVYPQVMFERVYTCTAHNISRYLFYYSYNPMPSSDVLGSPPCNHLATI